MAAKKMSAKKSAAPIKINPANKGKLRSSLGAKKGQTIPAAKLAKAAKSSNPATRKRAQFALNAKKWKH